MKVNALFVDTDENFAEQAVKYLQVSKSSNVSSESSDSIGTDRSSGGDEGSDIRIVRTCRTYAEATEYLSRRDRPSVNAVVMTVGNIQEIFEKHEILEAASGDYPKLLRKTARQVLELLQRLSFQGPVVIFDETKTGHRPSVVSLDRVEGLSRFGGKVIRIEKRQSVAQVFESMREALQTFKLPLVLADDRRWTDSQLIRLVYSSSVVSTTESKLQPIIDPAVSYSSTDSRLALSLLENAPRPIVICTSIGIIVFVNKVGEELFGISSNDFVGLELRKLLPELDAGDGPINYNRAGETLHLSVAVSSVVDGHQEHNVYIFTDLTPHKRREERLRQQVEKLKKTSNKLKQLVKSDPLTGLMNRRGLTEVLHSELAHCVRSGAKFISLLVDLDDFKSINDNYGHDAGDAVLVSVAEAIRDSLRTSDWVGRVGGDEFLVFLRETTVEGGMQTAERVRKSIEAKRVEVAGRQLGITSSIGVVEVREETGSIEDILRLSKAGLKSSKKGGKNRVALSSQSLDTAATQLESENALIRFMKTGKPFRVAGQSVRNLRTGKRVGTEFFSRGPTGELSTPGLLFSIAKECNILSLVDAHSLKSCLLNAGSTPDSTLIHANLYPTTLLELNPKELLPAIHDCLGPNRRLCIELNERHIRSDAEKLAERIAYLKREGILIAFDDVGAGNTSLETISLLEPDVIKIDNRLVLGVSRDAGKAKSVQNLVKVSRALGIIAIAEGIENAEDLQKLITLGVEFGQGWFFDKAEAESSISREMSQVRVTG